MKPPRLLAVLAAFTALSPAYVGAGHNDPTHQPDGKAAPAGKAEAPPEWAGLFGGAPLPVVWQSAAAANGKIAAALAGRKLDRIAAWAETIHLASHALVTQVKPDVAGRAKELKGALRQAVKFSDEVIEGARHGELDQTAAAHRRLDSALVLAKSLLPREILDAPPQELRFAKAAEAALDGKGEHGQKQ